MLTDHYVEEQISKSLQKLVYGHHFSDPRNNGIGVCLSKQESAVNYIFTYFAFP